VFHRQFDHLADPLDLRLEATDVLVGDAAAGLLEAGDGLLAELDVGVLGDGTTPSGSVSTAISGMAWPGDRMKGWFVEIPSRGRCRARRPVASGSAA